MNDTVQYLGIVGGFWWLLSQTTDKSIVFVLKKHFLRIKFRKIFFESNNPICQRNEFQTSQTKINLGFVISDPKL